MLLSNYSYINSMCGHSHSGITVPNKFIQPQTMRGWFSRMDYDSTMLSQVKRDSFPTGGNPPYCYVLGDKGCLMSATTTISGTGAVTSSVSLGKNCSATLAGSGTISNSQLSLLVQLSATLIGTSSISAEMKSILNMASDLVGSGDISGGLSLIAFVVADLTGSGTITGTGSGIASMSADLTPFSELSPETLAAAVWSSLAASFNDSGTMGNKLNSASAAGDPWSIDLSTYTGDEAGKTILELQQAIELIKTLNLLKL